MMAGLLARGSVRLFRLPKAVFAGLSGSLKQALAAYSCGSSSGMTPEFPFKPDGSLKTPGYHHCSRINACFSGVSIRRDAVFSYLAWTQSMAKFCFERGATNMALSDLQKKTCQAIVNIFETSRIRGDYGQVTLLKGDTGQLTYGRSQTTLGSGNLYFLIKQYCETPKAKYAAELKPYLKPLQEKGKALNTDFELRGLLSAAGDDPVMQAAQDAFFDRTYWDVAVTRLANIGANTALGTAIAYDSTIHGSWGTIRERVGALVPGDEQGWLTRYVQERRNWLATHDNELLHKTVYRMDALAKLINENAWDLPLPLNVRGLIIDTTTLSAEPEVLVSAKDKGKPIFKQTKPLMTGSDVRKIQQALNTAGIETGIDSKYGKDTAAAVEKFQKARGLKVDGEVGPTTWKALGLG